ncbi:MAG: hypothetical protein ACLUI3_02900 [Christensenellales bacterium]
MSALISDGSASTHYTQKEASEYIRQETAKELYQIFGPYQPELTARDFYDMEISSASIMRGYMAHPCDERLTLEKKLRLFLTMRSAGVQRPKEKQNRRSGSWAGYPHDLDR